MRSSAQSSWREDCEGRKKIEEKYNKHNNKFNQIPIYSKTDMYNTWKHVNFDDKFSTLVPEKHTFLCYFVRAMNDNVLIFSKHDEMFDKP